MKVEHFGPDANGRIMCHNISIVNMKNDVKFVREAVPQVQKVGTGFLGKKKKKKELLKVLLLCVDQ